jgi:hypothetical protein
MWVAPFTDEDKQQTIYECINLSSCIVEVCRSNDANFDHELFASIHHYILYENSVGVAQRVCVEKHCVPSLDWKWVAKSSQNGIRANRDS